MSSIVFDKSVKREILDLFDKTIDSENMIVEKDNPNIHVRAIDATELTLDEFGGIKKGSEIFIKNDLVSLMKIARR